MFVQLNYSVGGTTFIKGWISSMSKYISIKFIYIYNLLGPGLV